MKKKCLLSVILCGLMAALSHASAAPVLIYVSALAGPDVSNTNGANAYETWASNAVQRMYMAGTPLMRIDPLSDDIGHILQTAYVAQPSALTSNTAWFAVHVVSSDPAYKFLPGQLMFKGWSSDPAHSLAKTNGFSDPTFVYAPSSIGVVWGVGGPRTSDTLVTGFWKDTPVNEFIFIGCQSKYFVYGSLAGWTNIDNYVHNNPTDFMVTGTWEFMDAASNILAYANKTLHLKGLTGSASLSITNVMPTKVVLGVMATTNDTWILQQASAVNASSWTDMATVNGSDILQYVTALGQTGFWRLLLE